MAIAEAQLETWAHQGAIQTSSDTYGDIRDALTSPLAAYAARRHEIFLQGSYANATNVWAESDVDVVIQLNEIWYSDITGLTPAEQAVWRMSLADSPYGYAEFRAQVLARLTRAFGAGVDGDGKAIFVTGDGRRRAADVLPAISHRRYLTFPSEAATAYVEGLCFFTADGAQYVNYPRLHAANCTAKHQVTEGWFKPCVRILKNMRNRMVETGFLVEGAAPSHFLECALYNVPDPLFGRTYAASLANALTWLWGADRRQLLCANRLGYLLDPSSPAAWRAPAYNDFLSAAAAFWAQGRA